MKDTNEIRKIDAAKHFRIPEENEAASAFWEGILEARTFVSKEGQAIPYRLFVPEDYSPLKKYPFQLHLHGGGLRGSDNLMQLKGDHKQTQMLLAYQKKEPFVFVIPQCPTDVFWGYSMTYDTNLGEYMLSVRENNESPVIRALMELVNSLTDEFSVDKSRLYISGCSMGGMGSYDILARHPDVFAAAFVGCAPGDLSTVDIIKRIPIYICHGSSDQAIPVKNSRNMAAELKAAGADYVYTEFEGRLHDFTGAETGDDELAQVMAWVHSKKRI